LADFWGVILDLRIGEQAGNDAPDPSTAYLWRKNKAHETLSRDDGQVIPLLAF
jgi:hypothetical protein